MAGKDAELLREAYASSDFNAFAGYLHPDAVLEQASAVPDADTYRGKAEFLRGAKLWNREWEDFRYRVLEIVEGPQGVLMRVLVSGRGRGSGVEIEQEVFHVWEIRDGQLYRCVIGWTESDARRAAGL